MASADEGVVDVSSDASGLCVKSLRSASSNSYVVSHPAEFALCRACTPCTNIGERLSRTSCSSYVVASTERTYSSRPSSMLPPAVSTGATAEQVLISKGKSIAEWAAGLVAALLGLPEHLVSWPSAKSMPFGFFVCHPSNLPAVTVAQKRLI